MSKTTYELRLNAGEKVEQLQNRDEVPTDEECFRLAHEKWDFPKDHPWVENREPDSGYYKSGRWIDGDGNTLDLVNLSLNPPALVPAGSPRVSELERPGDPDRPGGA